MYNNIFRRKSRVKCSIFILCFSVMLSACSLPNNGPRSSAFEVASFDQVGTRTDKRNQVHERIDYVLVDVDTQIMKNLTNYGKYMFAMSFPERSRPAADIRIGSGDTIGVTIFEASAGGLFIAKNASFTGGNFVRLPEQEVDSSGKIKIPYGGYIQVVGRFPESVQKEIEEKLANRAIEPQAVVSITKRASNKVTVLGDVQDAGRFNINLSSYKILDALASAKGSRYQDFETLVTLQRKGRRSSVRLSALTHYPNNNIEVQLGDTIFVQRKQNYFSVLGAVKKPGEYLFDRSYLTAANAIAKGQGLIDERADPYTLVIYRLEDRVLLEKYGARIPEKYGKRVPTIYRINIRDTDGFFFAKHFQMRHQDLVYVANSPWVDALKINSIIRDYASTIRSGRGVVETFTTKIPGIASITN